VAVVTHPRSPLHELASKSGTEADSGPLSTAGAPGAPGDHAGCVLVRADDEGLLTELVSSRVGLTVLVDDVEAVADTAVERVLQQLVRPGATGSVSVVVSGTTSELAATYRGLAVDVRRSRTGLLLGPPAPADGDLLGTRLPRTLTVAGPPGRGVLVVRGRPLLVQVPTDEQ